MLRSLFLVLVMVFVPSFSSAKVVDLSKFGDIVVTDANEAIVDHFISVSWDTDRNEWVGRAVSPKNENSYLIVRYPGFYRMFCELGELIPMPVKNTSQFKVKLFQLYTDRKDISIDSYIAIRDRAHRESIHAWAELEKRR